MLVPVIKDMNRRDAEGTQSNITGFFAGATGAGAFAPRKRGEVPMQRGVAGRGRGSKRLEGALGRLREGAKRKRGRDGREDDGEGESPAAATPSAHSRPHSKKKPGKRKSAPSGSASSSSSEDESYNPVEDGRSLSVKGPRQNSARGRRKQE